MNGSRRFWNMLLGRVRYIVGGRVNVVVLPCGSVVVFDLGKILPTTNKNRKLADND